MEKITDWNSLWRELVQVKDHSRKKKFGGSAPVDVWAGRALEFKEGVKRKWARPDSSREFILSQIRSQGTVLDIGAGTGAWTVLFAKKARHVTAVEPSGSMIEVLREGLAAERIANVAIMQGEWPDVSVAPHDYSLCSHAMYACTDLRAFILRMNACTRQMCFLLLRAPSVNGVRAEAALHIWGQPMDSPNFIIAYNVLLQAGIYANVLMEDTGFWKPRTSISIEEALADMRRFMGLGDTEEHDQYLRDLLERRLTYKDGKYFWPPDVRSALIYWQPGS